MIPVLAAGDLVIASVAGCIALYESWVFAARPERREHLWAAVIAGACTVYALAMMVHYTLDGGTNVVDRMVPLTRIEMYAVLVLAHGVLGFSEAVVGERMPMPVWARVAGFEFWVVAIPTALVVPRGFVPIELTGLQYPFPQPQNGPLTLWLFMYCLFIGVVGAAWIRNRQSNDAIAARTLVAGLLVWGVTALHDTVLTEFTFTTPMYLMEYGFLFFGMSVFSRNVGQFQKALQDSKRAARILESAHAEAMHSSRRIERLYGTIVSSVGEGLAVFDEQQRTQVWNPAMTTITGVPEIQAKGVRWSHLVKMSDRGGALWDSAVDQALTNNASVVPVVSIRVGVRRRFVSATITPLTGRNGRLDGFIAAINDVTERRIAEDLLRRSEQRFRTLIERSPVGIGVHRDGRVVYANPTLVDMLGYKADALVDASYADLITRSEGDYAVHINHLDGRALDAELVEVGVLFDGAPARVFMVRDVTEQKQLEARRVQMDRMITIGTLAASVGHEINNPLSYVMTNLEFCMEAFPLLNAQDATGGEFLEALSDALEGAVRVKKVLRDLRTLSRTDSHVPRPTAVKDVVESAIRMAGMQIREKSSLERDFRPVDDVMMDEGRLGQVVLNLLVNAAQSIETGQPSDNCITVQVRQEKNTVVISVQDTGPGIPDEVLQRVFEPFFTTKPVGEGTGLGLSICRELVADAGGDISIDSELGGGTRVSVALPASGLAASEGPASGVPAAKPQ